ncbi:FHA domain-containing protein [Variovorax paradoxus]|uniref:FHA domain-containing protein n=1 Tax=Variovorax paradoxus TaxID=34073 RepID=A0AAE3XTA8_VARPD|nr:type VI secretion system-associated FHA domain protein TagH [Variovorax paradoxus]MDP9963937.1 FHA domain-containing protein [Variovorax paradoxus]MDR6425323.1 FHA domain-containing protein [Variovorax paradoxus]MDR6453430.1 FHA domain-containing protein [Variovorax paradoxus]
MRWTVIEHAGKPVTAGPSALLAAPGGTIGRSPDNHLVLPDEQRQISRLQATVRFDDSGAAVLRNMSAVLPIGVNERTLQHEQESPIAEGDRVTIGSYVLVAGSGQRAAVVAPAAPLMAAAPPPASPVHSPLPASAMAQAPMDSLLPAAPVSDVFSDLFGAGALPIGDTQPVTVAMPPPPAMPAPPPAQALAVAPVPAAPPSPAPSPASTQTSASQIPSAADWDAILANAPRREASAAEPMPDPMAHEPFELPSQARRNPVDPLAELNPQAEDGMSDVALKRGMDPLSFFAADNDAPSPLSDPRPTALTHEDPLHDVHPAIDLLSRPPAPQGYSHSNHARELAAQFRPPNPVPFEPPAAKPAEPQVSAQAEPPPPPPPPPPVPAAAARVEDVAPPPPKAAPTEPPAPQQPKPVAAPSPVAAPPVPAAAPPSAPSSSDELFKAFLEGAGVPDVAGQQPLDAEAMRRLGRLMRAFTDGTIELLSSRAMLKREVRAEITMIVDEENNPFKILPNGRAVLMQMFGARMPGFLSPEAAVHDALGDLQSHQLGMVAGMRAALLTVLKRFDPTALNTATPHDGGLGEKLLPGGREARLWRQLQKLHAETTAAVEDDFQAVFGRAFQQAYDKEMERLKEARRA